MGPLATLEENVAALRTLREVGLMSPRVALPLARGARRWGPTPAAGYRAAARRVPDGVAVIDEEGEVSFAEVDEQSSALAAALAERGVGPDAGAAILCRNDRWFVLVATALQKTGATTLYLNTGFAGPQMAEVLEREGAAAVIFDEEFADLVDRAAPDVDRWIAHHEGKSDRETVADLVEEASGRTPEPPDQPGRQVILTSGTTGTPKGASRAAPKGLVTVTSLFQRVPWRVGDVHHVPAPMFHALGNGAYLLGSQLAHTFVLRRRFDPEDTLRVIEEHGVTGMTVVPVMLQRICGLPEETTRRYDVSSLRVVQCSGAALPGSLALEWMDRFGDNLYNLFASTEVAAATIATPEDLRAAPGTAGLPAPGVTVRLYDDDDQPVREPGETGRIFVGSGLRFEGYTGGEEKASIDGLLSIGDVGHFDEDGRLFVGGRDDEMIVSGGENVYPREVEDLLADHPDVAEVAVVGVEDEDYGQRLKAFVVAAEGASPDESALKAHVKENLANYKVPKAVEFLDELPRNQAGKILKNELD